MAPSTAVVAGALANKPSSGGEAWVRLNWALGLRRLGFRVVFLEEIDQAHCSHAAVDHFTAVVDAFGLADASLLAGGECVAGASLEAVRDRVHRADLLVNLSGNLRDRELVEACARRVYVDLDPGYTQLWHAQGLDVGLQGHHVHLTLGTQIGSAGCDVPTGDIAWRPVLPPVVLDEWPAAGADPGRFTTVATWRSGYGAVVRDGHRYGLKAHEFRKLLDLPRRAPFTFEVALAIHEADRADRDALLDAGWKLLDPRRVAGDPQRFRRYVQESSAELSPAQGIYVETRCGWVSDRTAVYLASGKPAVVQDTGLDLGADELGLVTFRSVDEAATAASAVVADHERHRRAARRIAEERFDSDVVLGGLLELAGAAP
jgi:hypothetical protein